MGEILKKRLKQGQIIGHPIEEATYNILVAAEFIASELDRIIGGFGLGLGQFSVLRILRAAGGDGLPRGEIGARMVDRAPDVTRTIDKLEAMGLVVRSKGKEDRRQSMTQITEMGLELLAKTDAPVQAAVEGFGKKLSTPEWIALNHLLERVYDTGE